MSTKPLFSVCPTTNWRISVSPRETDGFEQISEFAGYWSDFEYFPQEVIDELKWHCWYRQKYYCQIERQKEDGTWCLVYNWPIHRLSECKIILPRFRS